MTHTQPRPIRPKCPKCGIRARRPERHAEHCTPKVSSIPRYHGICTIDGCLRIVRKGQATCFRCSGAAEELAKVMGGRV